MWRVKCTYNILQMGFFDTLYIILEKKMGEWIVLTQPFGLKLTPPEKNPKKIFTNWLNIGAL